MTGQSRVALGGGDDDVDDDNDNGYGVDELHSSPHEQSISPSHPSVIEGFRQRNDHSLHIANMRWGQPSMRWHSGNYGTNSVNVEFQHGVAVAIALVAVEVACDVKQSHSNTLLKHVRSYAAN